jgi:hypothetical protein
LRHVSLITYRLIIDVGLTIGSTASERNTAISISRKLGLLPLAIDQAGAYIAARGKSLDQYLPLYEKQFAKVASEVPAEGVWRYNARVFTTWEVSFQALGRPAQELLTLCGFLDNGDIWHGLLPEDELKEELQRGKF